MFNQFDTVKAVAGNGKTIKEGLVVAQTTHGARIYDPKTEEFCTDSLINPEWFAFNSKECRVVLIKPFEKRRY